MTGVTILQRPKTKGNNHEKHHRRSKLGIRLCGMYSVVRCPALRISEGSNSGGVFGAVCWFLHSLSQETNNPTGNGIESVDKALVFLPKKGTMDSQFIVSYKISDSFTNESFIANEEYLARYHYEKGDVVTEIHTTETHLPPRSKALYRVMTDWHDKDHENFNYELEEV